jgi:hypothetical protein
MWLGVFALSMHVQSFSQSGLSLPDTSEMRNIRVIEEVVVHRKFYRSPFWPHARLSAHKERGFDEAFLHQLRKRKSDPSPATTYGFADTLDLGEAAYTRVCRTSIISVQQTDSLMEVIASGYDVQEEYLNRYSRTVGSLTDIVASNCTAVVVHPSIEPHVDLLHPFAKDTLGILVGMQLPFLVLESFIIKELPNLRDSLRIPPGIALFFLRSYLHRAEISEAWMFEPYPDAEGKLVIACRIIASGEGGLYREELPIYAEIVFDEEMKAIRRMDIAGLTSMSPHDQGITLEGVGYLSVHYSSETIYGTEQ